MAYIEVEKLSKHYGYDENLIKALDNVSFFVDKGELVVILGASGAGKTTLLNILGGMDSATSGKYIIDDIEVTKLNKKELTKFRKDSIGFVFQFYNLMPNLNAIENVMISSSLSRDSLSSKETLEKVGLGKRLKNFPSQLSGGEQQRVSIARALVKKPKLLLCDEPTGALDSKTGASIISLLCDMAHIEKKTVIIVTHNRALEGIADRIVRISDGKIIENSVNKNPIAVSDIKW